MAQMSYEEFMKFNQKTAKPKTDKGNKVYVRYFGLKEDNETAIVRFKVSTLDDIRIVSKHVVKTTAGKFRNIACLRSSPEEPLDKCPLCAAGEKISFRSYVPLLHYTEDEKGNTVAVPCLWEQSPKIRETLKSYYTDMGDLTEFVFKIVRHGKPGDRGTTYTILPTNPNVYKEDVFKKDFSGFDNLDFERFVTTKSAEDMNTFLSEGEFPNPFEKHDSASEEVAETIPNYKPEKVEREAPVAVPTPKGLQNPAMLRSSQPIMGRFTQENEQETPEVTETKPRRYTY